MALSAGHARGRSSPLHDRALPLRAWREEDDRPIDAILGSEDGVWPAELQDEDCYTRAGTGELSAGDINDPHAEHKRTDFSSLRDFDLDHPGLLDDLARCFKYWILLTDVDGFRLDTLKHVSLEQARAFCGAIKEFAAKIGKHNFFLVGEVAGGDSPANRYLDVLQAELNAALDIGEMRMALRHVAKGLAPPSAYFDGFDPGMAVMGSHRHLGTRHVSICDDHDHVFGSKLRFSSEASSEHQVVAAIAIQLFTPGIPCVYYGTEQALAGPEPSERRWLPEWGQADRYLREAMFGPERPRAAEGRLRRTASIRRCPDSAFGTAGHHCFDGDARLSTPASDARRTQGRTCLGKAGNICDRCRSRAPFAIAGAGEILPWSRILDDEEALCVVPMAKRAPGDVLVDRAQRPGRDVSRPLNTAQTAEPGYAGPHPAGSTLTAGTRDGVRFLEIRDLAPSEVLI